MPPFSKVLVANRGEIACRVLTTARGMGYQTVAVYSTADAGAPHVQLADEAVCIGAAPAVDSYLNIEHVLGAVRATGADAVHPGYGFLSENAAFAQACVDAGVVFIGPPPEAVRLMGDKARAKARMEHAGVPIVPGFSGHVDTRRLHEEAERIGFPLLVKATAGGGGRGIRLVSAASELDDALASARAEAQSAFGDATVMLERFISRGRHVEIQVFADEHGAAIHLGERDCTAQRRRQKFIEEAPSPIVDEALRASMGHAAVTAALAVGYRGAGTVEFIVDQAGHHYFLEMNTRLQVEHPVTELVTGLDLVRLQLQVAAGERLPLRQDDVKFTGHAIEARLYVEDPYRGFAPQTGQVLHFALEHALTQPGVRIDAGVTSGSTISPFYDAMVAKVIAHGSTRSEATRRLVRALADASLFGLRTNARFVCDLLESDEFGHARMHTGLIDEWVATGHALCKPPAANDETWALAFAVIARGGVKPLARPSVLRSEAMSTATLSLACDGLVRTARVHERREGTEVAFDGRTLSVQLLSISEHELRYSTDAVSKRARLLVAPDALHLARENAVFEFREPGPVRAHSESEQGRVLAPLAGLLIAIRVEPGAAVRRGDVLAVIEAMKMETRVVAQRDGIVAAVHRKLGEQVESQELLIELEKSTLEAP